MRVASGNIGVGKPHYQNNQPARLQGKARRRKADDMGRMALNGAARSGLEGLDCTAPFCPVILMQLQFFEGIRTHENARSLAFFKP